MKKTIKSITSFVIALSMFGGGFVMPASAAEIDASTLIVESIDTSSTGEEKESNILVGDYNISSTWDETIEFNMSNATNSVYDENGVKIGKKFRIHDNDYTGTEYVSHKITKRPTQPGEYIITRTSSSGSVYTADGYIERYVGDNWGYAGYAYNDTVTNHLKDVSEAEGGYAVYTLEVIEGSCLEDAYLAIRYIDLDDGWVRSSGAHRGAIIAGVPLEKYYDVTKLGKQTVAVPLSEFEFSENDEAFLGVATNNGRSTYAYFDDRAAWRASNKIQLDGFAGMGVARDDTNPNSADSFEVWITGLAIVKDPDCTPVLTVEGTADGNSLSWTASGYTDTTYTVTKTRGSKTETIEVGSATSYVDSDIASGETTYTVSAKISGYDIGGTSEPVSISLSGDISKPAASLLVEDFTVPVGGSNETERAKPMPFFIGDFYVSSTDGGTLRPNQFQPSGYYDTYSDYQRWYINDSGFAADGKGREITRRPRQAGEYYATRVGNESLKADAYYPLYAGVMGDGTQVAEEWIHNNWGFNGYRYANNVLTGNYRNIEEYVDTASVVYTVNVPAGMNIDGVYLAVTHTDSTWWIQSDGSHSGEVAVGVPLKNYYDTSVGGWQTIKVPFADFDFTVNRGDNDKFVFAMYGSEYVLYNAYADYRKYNEMHWESFTGIGIVREDVDDTKCEEFYIDVKDLAIVNDLTEASALTATFDNNAKAVNLSWTASGYTDTTYTITKSNGTATETIEVGNTTEYVDSDIKNGEYTYTVESSVGKYAIAKTSAAAKVTVSGIGPVKNSPTKLTFNWADYYPDGDWRNYLEGSTYNVGTVSYWNNFTYPWRWNKADAKQVIADSSVGGDSAINFKLTEPIGTEGNPVVDIGISNDGAFGYLGHSFVELGNYPDKSKIADDVWMGVKDLSDYKDNGYAVFTITEATNVEDAYLCIMAPADNWQFSGFLPNAEGMWPITRETHENCKWGFGTVAINGVKLTDYYDTSKGGTQKVAIPLKKLVDSPDFKEFAGKTIESITKYYEKENHTFDLSLFSGMGVAKRDTSKGETMTVRYTALEIVAYEAPENFEAVLDEKTATLTWDESMDDGVTYRVVKTVNGETEYINVGEETSYVDENLADGVYTYAVQAYDEVTGLSSPASTGVELIVGNADPVITVVEVDMQDYEGKAWDVEINYFNAAKAYSATFVDGTETKTGKIGFENVEADGGSIAFAIFLHTSRASVALNVVAE